MDLAERAIATCERRATTRFELRADAEGDGFTFDGVASVVDTPYEVHDMLGTFTETMAAGAFAQTLRRKDDIRLLVNHEGIPLARTKSGTMRLMADPNLRAIARLDPASTAVTNLKSAVDRGDIDQMSIGFRVIPGQQDWNKDYTERVIREVELLDVSVVTFPASPTTAATMRSFDKLMTSLRADMDSTQVRRAIRELGSLLVKRAAPADLDESPAGLAAAIDAVLDQLAMALAAGDLETATALCTAAEATADSLLEVLAVPDPDDVDAGDVSGMPMMGMQMNAKYKALTDLWELRRPA